MAEVTRAVIKAEGSLNDAVTSYKLLIRAEQAIIDSPDALPEDKEIAARGVVNAQRILDALKAATSF